MLNVEQEKALRAIVEAPQAWCPIDDLGRKGHSVETLCELSSLGWIEIWETNRAGQALMYRSWAVTPWAAQELGLVLVEARGIPFWAPEEDLHPFVARRAKKEHRLSFPDLIPPPKKATKPAAQYIASIFWSETTGDPSRAERILGAPVELDERL
jgi:hypothetical protein